MENDNFSYTSFRDKNKQDYKECIKDLRTLLSWLSNKPNPDDKNTHRWDAFSRSCKDVVINGKGYTMFHTPNFLAAPHDTNKDIYYICNLRNRTTIAQVIKSKQNPKYTIIRIKPKTVYRWFLEGVDRLHGRKVITFASPVMASGIARYYNIGTR